MLTRRLPTCVKASRECRQSTNVQRSARRCRGSCKAEGVTACPQHLVARKRLHLQDRPKAWTSTNRPSAASPSSFSIFWNSTTAQKAGYVLSEKGSEALRDAAPAGWGIWGKVVGGPLTCGDSRNDNHRAHGPNSWREECGSRRICARPHLEKGQRPAHTFDTTQGGIVRRTVSTKTEGETLSVSASFL
jgi:hypothetical protein